MGVILVASTAGCLADGLFASSAPTGCTWPRVVPSPGFLEPELSEPWASVLDAAAPALAAVPWADLAGAMDSLGSGGTVADFGNETVRRFAVAASVAHARAAGGPSPLHPYGHPAFNGLGARVPVAFAGHAGTRLDGVVYLPENGAAPADRRYPAVVAMHGLGANWPAYEAIHVALADHGFIVLAFDFTGHGRSDGSTFGVWDARVDDATAALDFLLDGSPVAACVDAARIGLVGHSMGSITALELAARDSRIAAVVANAPVFHGAAGFPALAVPVMLQTGDHDGPIAPSEALNYLAVRQVYDALAGNRALIVTEAATHAQHTNLPMAPTPTWSLPVAIPYAVAWFDHHLAGSPAARDVLTRSVPHLSAAYASEFEIDGVAGHLGGAIPPVRLDRAPVEAAASTADGAWRVTYSVDARADRSASVVVHAVPLAPGALPVASTLDVGPDASVRWRLTALGREVDVALAPPQTSYD